MQAVRDAFLKYISGFSVAEYEAGGRQVFFGGRDWSCGLQSVTTILRQKLASGESLKKSWLVGASQGSVDANS
jgi:hypothetical protein